MNNKRFGSLAAAAILVLTATSANATLIDIAGVVTTPTGAFMALTPAGTPVAGFADVDASAVVGGAAGPADFNTIDINVGGLCFSTQATPMCPLGGGLVPIVSIDSAALLFMGEVVGGTLDLTAFSPTFGISIPILVDFDAGTFFADAGVIGTVGGDIAARVSLSVPEPGLALLFMIGLAAMGRLRAGGGDQPR